MFREIILPIFTSTRLCVTVCSTMHPRCCRPVAGNIVSVGLWVKWKWRGEQDRQCTYDVTLRGVHVTIVTVEEQFITYSEFVSLALVIEHAIQMCRIISSMACPALPYFSTLSHKWYNSRKIVTDYTAFISTFYTTSPEIVLILRIIHKFTSVFM